MMQNQLSIFKRRIFSRQITPQTIEPIAPTGESSVMKTLPAYLSHLQSSIYAQSTVGKYYADVKKFSVFIRERGIGEITQHDIEQWIGTLLSKTGESLDRKTVNRKVSAIINYFYWLADLKAIKENPTAHIQNRRTQSKLPDYLFEHEIKTLYQQASKDPRTYLIVLLLLETGMKSSELTSLKTSDIDTSDPYTPEIWVKHKGRNMKKDRKIALPQQFMPVYLQYKEQYAISHVLFPYTDRFIQLQFAGLKRQTGIEKELTPKTLRHTHVVRSYRRGESSNRIFERIGLAPDSRIEAEEVYKKLAGRGI